MKLNQATNLRVEDYPDQNKWIGRLFIVLNSLFASLNQVLDGNIDYITNIRAVTREYDTSALSFPIIFAWPYTQGEPKDLRVTQASADAVATILEPAWSFNASTRQISVSYMAVLGAGSVSAVTSGVRYKFTIRATV
jgi:hypothetical protein